MDSVLVKFIEERKEKSISGKINSNTSEDERLAIEDQAAETFFPENWVIDAAKRAKQLSLTSHPGKFSHPDAKGSPVIAEVDTPAPGYLCTATIPAELDCFGNAAALDVKKFLDLKLAENKTLLQHLEEETSFIQRNFTFAQKSFAEIREDFLMIKTDENKTKTSGLLKQVYFPVGNNYHLLSLLTPSTLMFDLKDRINNMHFSEEAKAVREKRKAEAKSELKLSEIYNLTVIGFGGTKPQNISSLNSKSGGTAYLLSSLPPSLERKRVYPPRTNFFTDCLQPKQFREAFATLHKVLSVGVNNLHVRAGRDAAFRSLLYGVADRLWEIRQLEANWSDSDNYQNLPHWQKIWLDEQYAGEREGEPVWFKEVQNGLIRWLGNSYHTLHKDEAVSIGDADWQNYNELFASIERIFL